MRAAPHHLLAHRQRRPARSAGRLGSAWWLRTILLLGEDLVPVAEPSTAEPITKGVHTAVMASAEAKAEDWYRKVARTFDPKTGKVASEEVFRWDVRSPATSGG
jgi:hypothetical protein